jgi:hypothetical protein
MAEYEEVPYSFLEQGDVYRMTDEGILWQVIQVWEDGTIEIRSKTTPHKSGKPNPEKIVQVRTVNKEKPTPAGMRYEEQVRKTLSALDAIALCAEKMTPGEVAMHLFMYHGIEATGYASVNMEARARGKSLRETHEADHAGMREHGVKPPQIEHHHDQVAFERGDSRWLIDSRAKTQ